MFSLTAMIFPHRTGILSLAIALLVAPCARADDSQDVTIFEAIHRINRFDLSKASDKVKGAVNRVLKVKLGQPEYFEAVGRFRMTEQSPELLRFAVGKGGSPEATKATNLLFDFGQEAMLKEALADKDEAKVGALMQSLVATNNAKGVALVVPFVTDGAAGAATNRAAVTALGFGREGEQALIRLARERKLPETLHLAASAVFRKSSDPTIREEAVKVIPMPSAAGSAPLPPIADLIKRTGDTANGKAVFGRICSTCHQVGNIGINFGPALSEIGSKLPKDALYTSIFDPSAGISFGFEGYEMKLKDGTTLVGFIASETADEVAVSVPGGITLRRPPGDILKRKKLPVSLMPGGLQAAMTEQELVDLIEFLAGLRKLE